MHRARTLIWPAVMLVAVSRAAGVGSAPASAPLAGWASPRPPGVAPDHWIAINPDVGIVIGRPDRPIGVGPQGPPFFRKIDGYIAIRHGGQWWRLQVTAGGGLTPLLAALATAGKAPGSP